MNQFFCVAAVALAAFGFSSAAHAQFKFTPEVGGSILKSGFSTEKVLIGPRIGVNIDYFFNKKGNGWAISSGLNFYQKKNHSDFSSLMFHHEEYGWQVIDLPSYIHGDVQPTEGMKLKEMMTAQFNTRRDYLQIPIRAQYRWNFHDIYAVSVAAGGYIAVGVGGKHQIDESRFLVEEKKPQYDHTSFSPYNLLLYERFDAGFSSKISLHAKHLSINLMYETNLYRRNALKENLISMSAGYTF